MTAINPFAEKDMSAISFSPARCSDWDFLLWLTSASDLEKFGRDSEAEFLRFATEDGKCDNPSGITEIDGVLYEYAWPGGTGLPSVNEPGLTEALARAYSYKALGAH